MGGGFPLRPLKWGEASPGYPNLGGGNLFLAKGKKFGTAPPQGVFGTFPKGKEEKEKSC